jgi:hypothetical protein
LTVFTNAIDPNLEEDVQWIFIDKLSVRDGALMVTSEHGKTYQIDRVTREVGEATIPRLHRDALLVGKSEAASALIYWNAKRYVWFQQGD